MTSKIITHVYPAGVSGFNALAAAQLNNDANTLESNGDLVGAEKVHLQALALKIKATGATSIQTALTRNALGELYMKMEGKWEEAKEMLEEADKIRSKKNDFDAACTRDNLGRLWEMKGDMMKARSNRERLPGSMICGNFDCPKSRNNKLSKRTDLKQCMRCKCVFYCGAACQKADWQQRHKKLCKAPEPEPVDAATTFQQ